MKISRAHCKAGSSRFAMTNKTFAEFLWWGDSWLMNRLVNVDLGVLFLRRGRFRWFRCFVGGRGASELGFEPCQAFFQLSIFRQDSLNIFRRRVIESVVIGVSVVMRGGLRCRPCGVLTAALRGHNDDLLTYDRFYRWVDVKLRLSCLSPVPWGES